MTAQPSAPSPGAAAHDAATPDADRGSWVARAPAGLRPYLRLARYDRPVGVWLLAAPCWMGVALGRIAGDWTWTDLVHVVLFGLGALAMRGAGCTWNDLIDRDIDAQVARTASRPLASGAIGTRGAAVFLAAQLLVGLGVLLALPFAAQITALCAIPLVAAYPFMKRITWFPQAWLGFTFNWGVLVGFAATSGGVGLAATSFFLGCAAWTFGYDTIYAHQDKEDDALVGVKSTARFFAGQSRAAVTLAYLGAAALWGLGVLAAAGGATTAAIGGLVACAWAGSVLFGQVARVDFDDAAAALAAFKGNAPLGVLFALGLALGPLLGRLAGDLAGG